MEDSSKRPVESGRRQQSRVEGHAELDAPPEIAEALHRSHCDVDDSATHPLAFLGEARQGQGFTSVLPVPGYARASSRTGVTRAASSGGDRMREASSSKRQRLILGEHEGSGYSSEVSSASNEASSSESCSKGVDQKSSLQWREGGRGVPLPPSSYIDMPSPSPIGPHAIATLNPARFASSRHHEAGGSSGLNMSVADHHLFGDEVAGLSQHSSQYPSPDYGNLFSRSYSHSQQPQSFTFPMQAPTLETSYLLSPHLDHRLHRLAFPDREQTQIQQALQAGMPSEEQLQRFNNSVHGSTFTEAAHSSLIQSIMSQQGGAGGGASYVASPAAAPTYSEQNQGLHAQEQHTPTSAIAELIQAAEGQARMQEPQNVNMEQYDSISAAIPPNHLVSSLQASTSSFDQTVTDNRPDIMQAFGLPGPYASILSSSTTPSAYYPHQRGPLAVPPCEEGPLPPHSERAILPLSGHDDATFLSSFLCFVRSDCVEIFRASGEDVASRINSKKVTYQQVGIRCRFCAHVPHDYRAPRSATFPSSLDRIYQNVTMMLREHFSKCDQVPEGLMARFDKLKAMPTKGSTGARNYWLNSARNLGLVDSKNGIRFYDGQADPAGGQGLAATTSSMRPSHPASSSVASTTQPESSALAAMPVLYDLQNELLVEPEDRELVSDYLFMIMAQLKRVSLSESERMGNQRNFEVGMPGLGCRHCYGQEQRGTNHFFPPKRRMLPGRVRMIHQHLQRCTMCPQEIKVCLSLLESSEHGQDFDEIKRKAFFDRIWARLHGMIPPGVPADSSRERSEGL